VEKEVKNKHFDVPFHTFWFTVLFTKPLKKGVDIKFGRIWFDVFTLFSSISIEFQSCCMDVFLLFYCFVFFYFSKVNFKNKKCWNS